MDEHLGYERHQKSPSGNGRNGKTSKRVKTEDGEFELETPRDRDGSFEPKLVKKHQSRFTSMDDKILWLYAQGEVPPINRTMTWMRFPEHNNTFSVRPFKRENGAATLAKQGRSIYFQVVNVQMKKMAQTCPGLFRAILPTHRLLHR